MHIIKGTVTVAEIFMSMGHWLTQGCLPERAALMPNEGTFQKHLLELRRSRAGAVTADKSRSLARVKKNQTCFIACQSFLEVILAQGMNIH